MKAADEEHTEETLFRLWHTISAPVDLNELVELRLFPQYESVVVWGSCAM